MPVPQALAKDAAVVGPLGSLALSVVRAASPMMVVRTLRWYRDLARLGVHLPLFLVHDVGLLYAAPKEQLAIGTRPGTEAIVLRAATAHATYASMIAEIAQSEASARARTLRLTDDLVVVVLARVLGSLVPRGAGGAPYPATIPFDLELVRDLDSQLPALFGAMARTFE